MSGLARNQPGLTGRMLGTWRLEVLIGHGTLGDVYRGAHLFRAQRAAIKVLSPRLTTLPDFPDRFRQTLARVAPLDHAHLVRVIQYDTQDRFNYIVGELVTAGSLEGLLHRASTQGAVSAAGARLPLDSALFLGHQALAGVSCVHAAGMVHGNIKPANLLLDRRLDIQGQATSHSASLSAQPATAGFRTVPSVAATPVLFADTRELSVKVADTGLAQLASAGGALTTAAPAMSTRLDNTVLFLSPEQCRGQPADQRSDVYALGVLLYVLVTGRQPFQSSNLAEAVRAHLRLTPPAANVINPDVPIGIAEVIARSLAKDPAERYESATDLAAALRATAPALAGEE